MTSLLFILLLLFQADELRSEKSLQSDPVTQRALFYFENIDSDRNRSESLWSLTQIYRENDSFRDRLFAAARASGADWTELLHNPDETEAFHDLALHFEDEYLHLYLQLQVYTSEERQRRLDQFYAVTSDRRLYEINETVARTGGLPDGLPAFNDWDFSYFLVLYYSARLDLSGDSFFESIAGRLEEIAGDRMPDGRLDTEFLHAALFRAHYRLDRFHSIASNYEILSQLDHLPPTFFKRDLYRAMDFSLYRAGQIDRSLEIQRSRTIPLTELIGDHGTLNQILATHGGYLYSIGRFEEASRIFNDALRDSIRLNPAIQTRLLNNLSLVYFKLGEYNRYLETQMRAHAFAVEQENENHPLSIYRNLHIYYRKTGNRDLALRYIDEAKSIAEQTGNRNELASIIISKAVYYDRFLEDTAQAFGLLEEASGLLDGTTNYRLRVRLLTEMADLHKRLDEHHKSREKFQEVLAIGAENQNDRVWLGALVDLAEKELLLERPEQAAGHLREFNAHNITLVDFPMLVQARKIEAELAIRNGDPRRAEELVRHVYEQVLEWARNTTDIEAGYWNVEPAFLELFRLYAELLLQQERFGELAGVLDRLKTINDAALVENPLVQGSLLTEEELAENSRITRQLDLLRKRYLVAAEDEQLALRNEIATLNARKNRLSRERSDLLLRPIHLWAIRSQLGNGEMVLHATRILDRLYLLHIDRQGVRHFTLAMGKEQEELFETAITSLATGRTDLETLHEIYKWLRLDRIPSSVRSLVVIPDSYLYQLPVDLLPVSEPHHPFAYGSAEYLIERMNVRYVNSLQDMTRREPAGSFHVDFTGIGISDFSRHGGDSGLVPLPGAVDEVNRIAGSLSGRHRVRTLTEELGTPGGFSRSAADSRILHLASHSTISESDPLFSRIYLHPEVEGESAEIFAYQLFDMNLNNELIMFNSCDSGGGEFFQGAGVMGLTRALRYAGARSLVLNSWIVNDHHASEFAVQLYRNLDRGMSKPAALRETKLHFLTHHNANPHYWGAYILNGDPRPVFRSGDEKRTTALLALLFAGALLLTGTRRTFRSGNGTA